MNVTDCDWLIDWLIPQRRGTVVSQDREALIYAETKKLVNNSDFKCFLKVGRETAES